MTRTAPEKEWWTAQELADARLTDIPPTKRAVNLMADRLSWQANPAFARRREGRGGGWEYHWRLLPMRAQRDLVARGNRVAEPEARLSRDEAWEWFDALPETAKAKARRGLRIVQEVEALAPAMTKFLAVETAARQHEVSARTIWGWFERIEGIDTADRLPFLAPRHRAAPQKPKTAEYSPEFFEYLKGAFLRPEPISFAAAFDTTKEIAQAKGWVIPNLRTMRRRMDRIPRVQRVYAREGMKGLEKCFPPQIRDKTQMAALEGVNADFHKFDFRVQWPGIDEPIRPQVVAFHDLYSNKFLSWRYDVNPNKIATVSAFGEMVDRYGIPKHITFDNGREFANKWLTGGVDNRFRFKILPDDPIGILPLLGIELHFATPHHGQAKPIERAFRDLADRVAKDPRFAGAYVGNKPGARPSNYGAHVIPFEDFVRICDEGFLRHNAREGRLTDTARGRSFDETFAESYERTAIRRATEEQRRLWLLGQEVCQLNRNHGRFKILEAEYWSDWMTEYAGQKVIGRFDPLDLNAGLYVYSLDGKYLGFAECAKKVEFYDHEEAKAHAKRKAAWKREVRKETKGTITVDVKQVAAALDACPKPELPSIEAKVVRLAQLAEHERGPLVQRPMPVPEVDPAIERRRAAMVVDFRPADQPEKPVETAKDRFQRAIEIEARSEAGERIGAAEADWLRRYQTTPEYTSRKMMLEDFGKDKFIG